MYTPSKASVPGKVPEPMPDQQPDVRPQPVERPRRRRITQPTFVRVSHSFQTARKTFITTLLVLGIAVAQAQTTPTQPPTPKPTTPTHPTPEQPDRPHPPIVPQDPTKPVPQATPQGWVYFNEQVGKEIGLEADQLQRLRDVDMKYRKDYEALGTNPTTNVGYRSLNDRRNTEVRGILTPEQYTRWSSLYNTAPPPPKMNSTPSTQPK